MGLGSFLEFGGMRSNLQLGGGRWDGWGCVFSLHACVTRVVCVLVARVVVSGQGCMEVVPVASVGAVGVRGVVVVPSPKYLRG